MSGMDIEGLKAFLAIADSGGFSQAAARIHLTQPAISKRIANLEAQLGTRLFDRIGKRVQLTEAGQLLYRRARDLLLELDDIGRAIGNLGGEIAGSIRFATSHHIGLHRLPPVLEQFHRAHPAVHLDLRFLDSEQACRQVAQGALEFAVVTLPPAVEPPLRAEPVWEDPIEVMSARSHPLAQAEGPVLLEDLLDWPALLPETGTYTRELVLQGFGDLRGQVRVEIGSNYLEVLRMLTGAGLGWSALPRGMREERLRVLDVPGLRLRRTLGVVIHRQRTLSNAGRAFLDHLILHGDNTLRGENAFSSS